MCPPVQRGLWMYMPSFRCVLHDLARCMPCAAFVQHLEPASETQVYQMAHDDQDQANFHDSYSTGFDHAEQEVAAIEE